MSHLEITKEDIITAIKTIYGDTVYPEDITAIKSFGRPTYVVDRGCQHTFLCRKTNLGIIRVKKIVWW